MQKHLYSLLISGKGWDVICHFPRGEQQEDDGHRPEEARTEAVVSRPWSGHGHDGGHAVGLDDGDGVVHFPQLVAVPRLPFLDLHKDGISILPPVPPNGVVFVDIDGIKPHFDANGVAVMHGGLLLNGFAAAQMKA